MRRWIIVCLLLGGVATIGYGAEEQVELARQAHRALRQATRFLTEEVAYRGGYLGAYTEDLGQGYAKLGSPRPRHMHWVEPPGTPEMGMVFFEAWQATGDEFFLDAAVQTAQALVRGQLESGGWYDYIDTSAEGERIFAYRRLAGQAREPMTREEFVAYCRKVGLSAHELKTSGNKAATLDDDITQSAIRLLMAVDRALETLGRPDAEIHEAVMVALDFMLSVQHESGGWPQNWPSLEGGRSAYDAFLTLNDHAHTDSTRVLMEAYRVYGDPRYRAAVIRAGEFLIHAQLPEPVPIWAQQYDHDLKPGWGRLFEPPAACTTESFEVMKLLTEIAQFSGEPRFLEPIPAAAAFYRRAQLADGRFARFYELKTGRPLYQVYHNKKSYRLTYSDHDLPDHYSFKLGGRFIELYTVGVDEIEATAARLLAEGLREEAAKKRTVDESLQEARRMESTVRHLLQQMDSRGAWIETQRRMRVIDLRRMQANMRTLADYARHVRKAWEQMEGISE